MAEFRPIDASTKLMRIGLRAGGNNAITPHLDDWYEIAITTTSPGVVVAHSTGDAKGGNGIRVPTEGALNLTVGPGSQLFAGGDGGEQVYVSTTRLPGGLATIQLLQRANQLLDVIAKQLRVLVNEAGPRRLRRLGRPAIPRPAPRPRPSN